MYTRRMAKSIAQSFESIEETRQEHASKVYKGLRPPAKPQDLEKLETELGFKLPRSVRALLEQHNGSKEPLFDAHTFLSSTDIVKTHRMRTKVAEDLIAVGARSRASTEEWWHGRLIPITDNEGDGFCVDAKTEVVYYHRHDDNLRRVAKTIDEWLESVAGRFEAGEFEISGGDVWLK